MSAPDDKHFLQTVSKFSQFIFSGNRKSSSSTIKSFTHNINYNDKNVRINLYHYGNEIKAPQFDSGHSAPPAQIVLPYENLVLLLLICGMFGVLAAISRYIGFMTSRHIAFGRWEEESPTGSTSSGAESYMVENSGDEHTAANQQNREELTMKTSSGPSDEFSVFPRKTLTCEFRVASGLLIYVVLTVVFRKTIFVQGHGPKPIVKAAAMALGVVLATDALLIGWSLVVEGFRGKKMR
ncbi:hypothetical protein CKM354_001014100 [Cercospora kikuchii]|uniref:Uncharacterized protein n=1 Tax=Cercospora kikuchii TaxID=84275 RepID=A0A9P3FKR5_9PEZI|nr:uncharacterized protein CKM354_001014100 [Cercospora kikuchii]GIZ47040.1 hypothetical protein CKM354_001014100 [Cercospora kikuchii]